MPKGIFPRPPPLPAQRRGHVVRIPLNGKRGKGKFAIVDARDYKKVATHRWYINHRVGRKSPYAQARTRLPDGRATTVQMHKLVLAHAAEVDHRNGNGLDNRRRNLRKATAAQNKQNRVCQTNNTSGYRGVNYFTSANKWGARIGSGRRNERRYLGLFPTAREAALAYDRVARRLFGRFARLNFPRRGERSSRPG